jgi:uncharacterized coiled-coil DUF342 family protein
MAQKGGEVARWDNEEIQFLVEQVGAMDPDLRTNTMGSHQEKYGKILISLNELFFKKCPEKSTQKSMAQLVSKLGKLKAEAKKIRKSLIQARKEIDKLPTGSPAEAREELEKKYDELFESVERKSPWYFT